MYYIHVKSATSGYSNRTKITNLVSADKLVAEGKTRHDTTFLEPEDGSKGAREEDAFYSSKGHHSLSITGLFIIDPLNGPVSLLLDTRHSLNGIEEVVPVSKQSRTASKHNSGMSSMTDGAENITGHLLHYASCIFLFNPMLKKL